MTIDLNREGRREGVNPYKHLELTRFNPGNNSINANRLIALFNIAPLLVLSPSTLATSLCHFRRLFRSGQVQVKFIGYERFFGTVGWSVRVSEINV